MKKTINVGCGKRTFKHYPTKEYECLNVDIRKLDGVDYICDVTDLSEVKSNHFDYMLASDIIEHFPISRTPDILKEWCRVVKVGGNIEFRLPNLAAICAQYYSGNARKVSWLLYGGQSYPENFHYVGFDRQLFTEYCDLANLDVIEYREEGNNMIFLTKKR